jgi:hypothetical protein
MDCYSLQAPNGRRLDGLRGLVVAHADVIQLSGCCTVTHAVRLGMAEIKAGKLSCRCAVLTLWNMFSKFMDGLTKSGTVVSRVRLTQAHRTACVSSERSVGIQARLDPAASSRNAHLTPARQLCP